MSFVERLLYCVLCREVIVLCLVEGYCTMSFVERVIVMCPLWRGLLYCILVNWGESTIGGSIVPCVPSIFL